MSAPALAAPPETPETGKATAVTATAATLNGVLNPQSKAASALEYDFDYKRAASECTGGSVAPEAPVKVAGKPKEAVSVSVIGLEPSREYASCVLAIRAGESSAGLPVSFKTLSAPPKVEGESAAGVKANEATLEAQLNPNNQETSYLFEYASEEAMIGTLGATKLAGSAPLSGFGDQTAAVNTGALLTANTTYYYRVIAKNAASEETIGKIERFTTALPPEVPEKEEATEVTGTTATLRGVLNPKAEGDPGHYEFLYRASASECEGGEGAPVPAGTALGKTEEAVSVAVTGLLPATKYTFCLRTQNEAQEAAIGLQLSFETTTAAPTVAAESAANVTATEATVSAQISPGGVSTTYQVEYEPGKRTSPQSLPASASPVGVQVKLAGLTPGSEYHYRFLAENTDGLAQGTVESFTTLTSTGPSGFTLPDNRAYELVSGLEDSNVYSPARGLDNQERPVTDRPFRASAQGDSVAYLADPPSEGGAGLLGGGLGNQYLATRTSGGWTATDIQPPGSTNADQYLSFRDDLSLAALTSRAAATGAPSCDRLVLRSTSEGVFHALFGPQPSESCPDEAVVAGFSGDVRPSHLLFQQQATLTGPAVLPEVGRSNIYDAVTGTLHLVNVLPNGEPEPEPNATLGSPSKLASGNIPNPNFGGAISHDATRVFWSSLEDVEIEGRPFKISKTLWVRENDTRPQSPVDGEGKCSNPEAACTVQVDQSQGPGSGGRGQFWAASGDGMKVLFTDCNRLTSDSTATPSPTCVDTQGGLRLVPVGSDLYEYDVGNRHVRDLTHTDPKGADVQGVVGVNGQGEDNEFVYFVAQGVLTEGANGEGRTPVAGQPNLYVLHNGTTVFVASLSQGDNQFEAPSAGDGQVVGDWQPNLADRSAQVSADGHSIVFQSRLPLTKYDNETSIGPLPEVFVYNADTARISCGSCNPSGAPPRPPVNEGEYAFGGFLPSSSDATYMLRWMSTDGSRVFFDTSQSLVSQDTNGRQDVYEWERGGSGSCQQSLGCIYLISGGTSSDASYFVDASANGDDVFFTDRDRLSAQARNENVKLYDARVNGGFPEASLACVGSGCQGAPPAPPSYATPSSVTFSGAGNFPPAPPKPKATGRLSAERLAKALTACRAKHNRHRRAVCEARARKRYALKAKRSARRRRR